MVVRPYGGLMHPIIGEAGNRFVVVMCDHNSGKLHIDLDLDFENHCGNQTQIRGQTRRKRATAFHT